MCSILNIFPQMSQSLSNSNAADNGLSASKIEEGDETKENETMEVALNGMEQEPSIAFSKK